MYVAPPYISMMYGGIYIYTEAYVCMYICKHVVCI